MRALAALGLALALPGGDGATPAQAQPAAGSPVVWEGRMRCEAIPGRTQGPLDVAFALTVRGDRAQYERNVRDPSSSQIATRYWERGEGVVAPDGSLRLAGSAAGRDWSYTAAYAGRLTAAGSAELRGEQLWGTARRPCVIVLRRPGG